MTTDPRVDELERELHAARQELHDFAHRVAHDLKSPLSVLLGVLDLIQRRPHEPADAELFAMATRSSQRLVDMIERLTEYADAASSDGMLGPVELEDAVSWAVESLDERLTGVDLEIGRPLPRVRGNLVALRHVFRNLLDNALSFADPSRPLRVTIRAERDDTGRIVVRVTDNGIGIEPRARSAVFGAGFRIDRSAPRSGLGLATVQRNVELMGGTVSIEDGLDGAGTTMRLVLSPDGQEG